MRGYSQAQEGGVGASGNKYKAAWLSASHQLPPPDWLAVAKTFFNPQHKADESTKKMSKTEALRVEKMGRLERRVHSANLHANAGLVRSGLRKPVQLFARGSMPTRSVVSSPQ
jgi:hypothetical protein